MSTPAPIEDVTGLPRPRLPFTGLAKAAHASFVRDGDALPVPWVAAESIVHGECWDALDHHRVDRCIDDHLCQVCGDPLGVRAVCAYPGGLTGEAGDRLPMHPRCARLALRRCPHLRAYAVRPRDSETLEVLSDAALDALVRTEVVK